MAWPAILAMLLKGIGGGAAAGAAGGGAAAGGAAGGAGGAAGGMGLASLFANGGSGPGSTANQWSTMGMGASGGGPGSTANQYATANAMQRTGGIMPQSGGGGGADQGGAQQKKELLDRHQNLVNNINSAFAGLKTFGTAFRGLDKTPLNMIERKQPPIILPSQIQNPGVVDLATLMAQIAGGR